jgi:hypothetical protein
VTKRIDVSSFSRLEVSDSFSLNVSAGEAPDVTVRIDDILVGLLDVRVSDGTLRIGVKSGTDVVDATLEADVTVSSLDELHWGRFDRDAGGSAPGRHAGRDDLGFESADGRRRYRRGNDRPVGVLDREPDRNGDKRSRST